jgi:hypothetical protein
MAALWATFCLKISDPKKGQHFGLLFASAIFSLNKSFHDIIYCRYFNGSVFWTFKLSINVDILATVLATFQNIGRFYQSPCLSSTARTEGSIDTWTRSLCWLDRSLGPGVEVWLEVLESVMASG